MSFIDLWDSHDLIQDLTKETSQKGKEFQDFFAILAITHLEYSRELKKFSDKYEAKMSSKVTRSPVSSSWASLLNESRIISSIMEQANKDLTDNITKIRQPIQSYIDPSSSLQKIKAEKEELDKAEKEFESIKRTYFQKSKELEKYEIKAFKTKKPIPQLQTMRKNQANLESQYVEFHSKLEKHHKEFKENSQKILIDVQEAEQNKVNQLKEVLTTYLEQQKQFVEEIQKNIKKERENITFTNEETEEFIKKHFGIEENYNPIITKTTYENKYPHDEIKKKEEDKKEIEEEDKKEIKEEDKKEEKKEEDKKEEEKKPKRKYKKPKKIQYKDSEDSEDNEDKKDKRKKFKDKENQSKIIKKGILEGMNFDFDVMKNIRMKEAEDIPQKKLNKGLRKIRDQSSRPRSLTETQIQNVKPKNPKSSAIQIVTQDNTRPQKSNKIYAKVISDYDPQKEGYLSIKAGEIIQIISQNESGWWESEKENIVGLVPSTYLEVVGHEQRSLSVEIKTTKKVVSNHDYEKRDETELDMKDGEVFTLINKFEGWYFVLNSEGREGYVPACFVDEKN
eukprot:Anaeramoba_ignava/a351992_73.p1 GENE.a351992_73~~a351992_73.p1  ORF type:complete len:564 (-),score=249.05 a351992_73:18-1709(-)